MNELDPILAEFAAPDANVDEASARRHVGALRFLRERFGPGRPTEAIYAASLGDEPSGTPGDSALESRLELGAALDALTRFDLAPDATADEYVDALTAAAARCGVNLKEAI